MPVARIWHRLPVSPGKSSHARGTAGPVHMDSGQIKTPWPLEGRSLPARSLNAQTLCHASSHFQSASTENTEKSARENPGALPAPFSRGGPGGRLTPPGQGLRLPSLSCRRSPWESTVTTHCCPLPRSSGNVLPRAATPWLTGPARGCVQQSMPVPLLTPFLESLAGFSVWYDLWDKG